MLYKYIWGVLKNNKCILYKINGVENHIHILTHLHPTTSLSALVKDIKVSTSIWIKKQGIFPGFKGWAVGYGAFTYTIKERPIVERYIENQVEHHSQKSYQKEYKRLLDEHKIRYDSKYL
jgi:REP element-mobilizing transposase RayT